MRTDPRSTVQYIVGWLAALVFLGLAYLSMASEYELTTPVIIGSILIIAMLLGKLEELSRVLERWNNR